MVTICISKCTPIAGSIFVVSFIRYWTYRSVHRGFLSVVNFENFASFSRSWHPGKKNYRSAFFCVKNICCFQLWRSKNCFYRNCDIFVPILRIKPWYFVLLSMLTAQKHKERATRIDKDSASKMSYKNRKLFINLKI